MRETWQARWWLVMGLAYLWDWFYSDCLLKVFYFQSRLWQERELLHLLHSLWLISWLPCLWSRSEGWLMSTFNVFRLLRIYTIHRVVEKHKQLLPMNKISPPWTEQNQLKTAPQPQPGHIHHQKVFFPHPFSKLSFFFSKNCPWSAHTINTCHH